MVCLQWLKTEKNNSNTHSLMGERERERLMMPIHHTVGRLDASIVCLVIYIIPSCILWWYFNTCGLGKSKSYTKFACTICMHCFTFGFAVRPAFCFYCYWVLCFFFQLISNFEIALTHLFPRKYVRDILHLHNVMLHFIPAGSEFFALCAQERHVCMHFAESDG